LKIIVILLSLFVSFVIFFPLSTQGLAKETHLLWIIPIHVRILSIEGKKNAEKYFFIPCDVVMKTNFHRYHEKLDALCDNGAFFVEVEIATDLFGANCVP